MTEVEFHYNVADKIGYSCRLLKKVLAADMRAVVIAEPATLQALDAALWSLGTSEFIPHCLADAPEPTREASPIWLVQAVPASAPHEVMINLGMAVPDGFERADRYLEVISTEAQDAEAGRKRWRHYQAQGVAIKRYDRQGLP